VQPNTYKLSLALTPPHFLTYLGPEEGAAYCREVPKQDWYVTQREALGAESFLYMFMRIVACETIQQWGFDEPTIDGHEVINQWAMLVGVAVGDLIGEGGTTVVTLECAGILPCSLAENVVDHIEKVWERGKATFIWNKLINPPT
jgi:hypothetical protein